MKTARVEDRAGNVVARLWRKRWFRYGLRLLAALVVSRLALAFALPFALDYAAKTRGLACDYRSLRISLLTGQCELHDLRLRDRTLAPDAEPLLAIDYANLDLALWRSLVEHPTVVRAEIDGLRALVEVERDGRVPWMTILGLDSPSKEAEPEVEQPPRAFDFTSPVEVQALRLHDIAVHVRDASSEPPLDATVVVDARLSDSGREQHVFELRASSRELFDRALVAVELEGRERTAHGAVQLELAGLRVEPLRTRLTQLGLTVPARVIDARCALDLEAAPREDSPIDCSVGVALHDTALTADGELIAALDRFDLQLASLRLESAEKSTLAIEARLPQIAEQLACSGQLELAWPTLGATLALDASGVAPRRLERVLRDVGLESQLAGGTFQAKLDARATFGDAGRIDGEATLSELGWSDASELARLDRLALRGVAFEPAEQRVHVDSIEIEGTRLVARRTAEGVLQALGFAFRATAQEPAPATAGTPAQLPRVEIGRLSWHTNALELADESVQPPLALAVNDFGIEVEGLTLGAASEEPARLRAHVAIDGLVEDLALDGTLSSAPGALDAQLELRASGLHTRVLREQLAALGIEPLIEHGSFAADVGATLRESEGVLTASLDLTKVALRDGERELAALDALHVVGATLGASTHVARIDLDGARVAATREPSGALVALGTRLVRKPAPSAPPASSWQDLDATFGALALPPIAIDALSASGIHAQWRDETLSPPAEFALDLRARVDSLSGLPDAAPIRFELSASVPGALADATLRGEAALAGDQASIRGTLAARGVKPGPLASYLPPGIAVELGDGRFEASFDARVEPCATGGRSASLALEHVRWSDGERVLAGFERASLRVARADAAQRVLDVDEIALAGVTLAVERATPTTWRALGVAVDTSALAAATSSAASPAAPRGPLDRTLPRVTLAKLDLQLARLEFVDRTRGESAAPIVADARLATSGPLTLIAPDPRDLPPFELALHAAVEPLAREIELTLSAAPYRDPLELELSAAVRGIDGEQLVALVPELAQQVDASHLKAGELSARASAELRLDRAGPSSFDFSKPFRLEFTASDLAFRAEPGGEVLAGLEGLRADVTRVDPRSGDVQIKTLELERPIGRVRRTTDGIEALGLLLKLPAAGDAPAAPPAHAAVVQASAPAVSESSPSEAPDISIGRLTLSGIDFVARDESVEPPVELGLATLEFEARKLSTRALKNGGAFQFNAALGARKQSMPVRAVSNSLLEGMAGAALEVLAGEKDQAGALEERPLFDEVRVAGKLALAPQLDGWATVDVSSLELVPLSGLARQSGLTIGDGVLDESLRVRFQGARGTSVESRAVFNHLSLSEPAGGPIERYLSLPAPLDTVLFLLKDFEGEHKVPVSFRLDQSGLSGGQMASAAAGAAASVISSAVASSPLRVAGTLTDLLGITGGEQPKPGSSVFAITFDAGATALTAQTREALAKARIRLGDDADWSVVITHQFSAADLARAAELASPALDDCRQLSLRLRRKRAELDRERDEVAAQARVAYAVGERDQAERAVARTRALEAERGLNENALDRVHELLKPGAERKREQRMRLAALAIASDRIARVRQALIDTGVAPRRIEVRQVRAQASAPDQGRLLLEPHERK